MPISFFRFSFFAFLLLGFTLYKVLKALKVWSYKIKKEIIRTKYKDKLKKEPYMKNAY